MENLLKFTLLFLLIGNQDANAQQKTPLSQFVDGFERKAKPHSLFRSESQTVVTNDFIQKGERLNLSLDQLSQFRREQNSLVQLQLPNQENHSLTLGTYDVHAKDFMVYEQGLSGRNPVIYQRGEHYRGVVDGTSGSMAAMSVFKDEVFALYSTPQGGNYVISKENDQQTYLLVNDKEIKIANDFSCDVQDVPEGKGDEPITFERNVYETCQEVEISFTCDFDTYKDFGRNTQDVVDYVTAMFNVVAVLYRNEGIYISISEIIVNTSEDGYNNDTSSDLDAFGRDTQNDFNGDLAHLISTDRGGGVAWIDVLCYNYSPRTNAGAFGLSRIRGNFNEFPTYSWDVNVIAHELGHNFGSPHTQSCSWSGGAIDNCYPTEGGCDPGPAPTNGGTIMSYCHLSNVGVNFSLGFGDLPGNLIRAKVQAAGCAENYIPNETLAATNSSTTIAANRECFDGTWTHYYFDNNSAPEGDDMLLLSLKKGNNNIGNLDDGSFSVKVHSTTGGGSGTATKITAPYVQNTSGFFVFNRFWEIIPKNQPSSDITVRFPYNQDEFEDLQGSVNGISQNDLLFFTLDAPLIANPEDNHNGATEAQYHEYVNDSGESHSAWKLESEGDTHFAIFKVSSLTSGGAGVSVNGLSPIENGLSIVVENLSNISCHDQEDGSISLSGDLGTAPYQFNFQGGAFSNQAEFTGLAAGSYKIGIRDAVGDTSSKIVTIIEPDLLQITVADKEDLNCFESADGEIEIAIAGGTGPFEAQIDQGGFGEITAFENLSAGNHTIQLKDANDCLASIAENLNQPTELELNVTAKTPDDGSGNGSVALSGNGGAGGYWFDFDGQSNQNGSFTNLDSGTYVATMIDQNECSQTLDVRVFFGVSLSLQTEKSVSCFGLADGAFSVLAEGGNGPYSFSFNDEAFGDISSWEGLAAGVYKILVRDQSDQEGELLVTVSEPEPLLLSTESVSQVTCNGNADGIVELNPGGGTAPYSYQIVGQSQQPDRYFRSLSPGRYSFLVLDNNGCEDTHAEIISEPSVLEIALELTRRDEGTNTGSLRVTALGGTEDYQYQIEDGEFQPRPAFENLAAGMYVVTVRDEYSCVASDSIEVLESLQLESELVQDISCFAAGDGIIQVQAKGGKTPIQYGLSRDSMDNSGSFNDLQAGTYVVYAVDSEALWDSITVELIEPSALKLLLQEQQSLSCFGENDGAITAAASGGNENYTYQLNEGPLINDPTWDNLKADTYKILAFDKNNCRDSIELQLFEPQALSVVAINLRSDDGKNSGAFTLNPQGGTEPYQITVNDGLLSNELSYQGISAGKYQVLIQDLNGCKASIEVEVPVKLLVSVNSVTETACSGSRDGTVRIDINGGLAPYFYSLNGDDFDVLTTNVVDSLGQGFYEMFIKDGNAEEEKVQFEVLGPEPISISFSGKTTLDCFGDNDGWMMLSPEGGNPSYQFSLDGNAFDSTDLFENLSPGAHQVVIRDAKSCEETLDFTVIEPAELSGVIKAQEEADENQRGWIQLEGMGGTPVYSFSINDSDYTATDQISNLLPGVYDIGVKDQNGCTAEFTTEILAVDQSKLLVYPNPFVTSLNVRVEARKEQSAILSIFNLQGVLKEQKTIHLNNGVNDLSFESIWKDGVYLFTISGETVNAKGKALRR